MPLMRYIGPRKAVTVNIPGGEPVLVEQGEAVPVSDEVLARTSWAPTIWEPVKTDKKEAK